MRKPKHRPSRKSLTESPKGRERAYLRRKGVIPPLEYTTLEDALHNLD